MRVAPSDIAARFALSAPQPVSEAQILPTAVSAQEEGKSYQRLLSICAFCSIFGALIFNFLLTYVNTRLFPVTAQMVILCELTLISLALFAAAGRGMGLYVVLGVFISYMLFLMVVQGSSDPKPIRDALIPIVFIFAGLRLASPRLANLLVIVAVPLTIAIGLFEYLDTDRYLDYFNVLGFYLAKGAVQLDEVFGQTRGLFISGMRPEPRTILPFLGQHRVSSIFLEPVSAGNFGAIAYAWALFSTKMRFRYLVMAGALAIVSFADARFGLLTCIVVTVGYPFYHMVPRQIWLLVPFIILAAFVTFGIATGADGGDNGVAGRLSVTSALLIKLPINVVLGLETTDQFVADSGFAYTLTQFGIFGFIGLWAAFVFIPSKSRRGWIFHSMIIIYFLMLLLISNSGYSIKTGALMWFLLGTALGTPYDDENRDAPKARRSLSPQDPDATET
ncbi:hypothetical protein [Rhizobium sp. L1K21]|uniref:hypothetical protein n=1 Tax=Rhizobium sp. L1K21 TaxID=2954933 RepID=UPI0020938658|nr:hypothetical protein [Rhizobium sp. L1K21]MCO6185304.1 hypothetical protein [Rhizobium sp. L1K21]